MIYTLYTAENCHQCKEVIDFLDSNKIEYTEVNIDTSKKTPPIEIFAFPALFRGEELISYGTDTKNYFTKKIQV